MKTDRSRYHMTIAEIKAALSIYTVLAHYGLEAGPTGSLPCPFHADAKASMKIYPETNTAYCFAGGCEVESVRRDRLHHAHGKVRQAGGHLKGKGDVRQAGDDGTDDTCTSRAKTRPARHLRRKHRGYATHP